MVPGMKYHHIGIPTQEKRDDEEYLPAFKVYVSSFDRSPFGVEWMRFEDDSPDPRPCEARSPRRLRGARSHDRHRW